MAINIPHSGITVRRTTPKKQKKAVERREPRKKRQVVSNQEVQPGAFRHRRISSMKGKE